MKEKKYHIFRKNVTLSVLLDILNRKKITMLSPMNWPDKNDSFVLDEYRKKKGAEHVYATCFSIDTDSVYHWNSFSNGSEGCRIEIKAQKFLERINSYQKIVHGEVKYLPVDFSKKIPLDQWPFVKRKQFACEHEYRLVLLTDNPEPYEIDLDPQLIDRISLSDSMPKSIAESVKEIIHKLCPNINVYCSTLNDNKQWQKHFK